MNEPAPDLTPLRLAVVEAAKVWVADAYRGHNVLIDAVNALLEAEKE